MHRLARVRLGRCIPWIALLQAAVVTIVTLRVNSRMRALNVTRNVVRELRVLDARVTLPRLELPLPRRSAARLPRALTAEEETAYMNLLSVLSSLLTVAGVEFIMCDGTLLGSYVFHGFIPWDDDADVMVNSRDIGKLKQALINSSLLENYDVQPYPVSDPPSNEYSLECLQSTSLQVSPDNPCLNASSDSYHKLKFYHKTNSIPTRFPWRWPFVDIKYYKINGTQVLNIDAPQEQFKVTTASFYPLRMRPLGTLWLPAPRDTQTYLRTKYGRFRCVRTEWNHRVESEQGMIRERCNFLTPFYPFVTRRKEGGVVIEELRLGGKLLHAVKLQQPWSPVRQKYEML